MPTTEAARDRAARGQSGNVLFYILIAIVLIAAVTVAMKRGGGEGSNIDNEQAVIAASQVKQYASSLERGVDIMLHNGISESDIRFAYPDAPAAYGTITDKPERQEFAKEGGAVDYQSAVNNANDGSAWEFYATSHAPETGAPDKAALMAVLPNIDEAVCRKINAMIGYTEQPVDDGACVYTGATGRFAGSYDDSGGANTFDETTFSVKPATEACVRCGATASDYTYHYYHVLIAR
jgi:hypothetical protein